MRAHDGQRGDVAVLHAVGGFFFHFCEYVADDFGGVVGGLGGARDLFFVFNSSESIFILEELRD